MEGKEGKWGRGRRGGEEVGEEREEMIALLNQDGCCSYICLPT